MLSKDGKMFGKISIIDIAVVLAIVVAAFGVYTRFFVGNEKVETASSHIEYTMRVSEVRQGTVDALKDFMGPVNDFTTKEYMGEIVKVEFEEAVDAGETASGQLRESVVPERYDAVLTVRVDGKINSSGYYNANNQAIASGGTLIFNSKAAKTTGVIEEVYEVK
ncbi:MAG: DUF4330 domain-containing protein [Clostridia bacterium]|nr:DUF4330 domain-containing protein [Clostridia bacterium]